MKMTLFKKVRNNKGMSLLEIIIVVAIMSAFIGLAGLGIPALSGRAVEKCAQQLVTSIQHTRTMSTSKNKTSIVICRASDGTLVVKEITEQLLDMDGNTSVTERTGNLGGHDVRVTCTLENGHTLEITGANTLELTFNRGSGALQETKVNGVVAENCVSITLTKGSFVQNITIIPLTGSVSRVM